MEMDGSMNTAPNAVASLHSNLLSTNVAVGESLPYSRHKPALSISEDEDADASSTSACCRNRQAVLDYCASVPIEERQAYTEAWEKSSRVVTTESDPIKFWQREQGDVEQAGLRLIRYWEHRKDRLGSERFYLPLDMTGEGALDEATIAAIKEGFLAFLPDDHQGRTVLYFDHALASRKLDGLEARNSRIRAEFYMLHLAQEREKPLVLVRYSESFQIDKAKMSAFQEYWTFAPFLVDSVYLAYLPPPGAKRIFKQTVAPLVAQHLSNLLKVVRDHKTFVGGTREELLHTMEELGFDRHRLPLELGGTVSTLGVHASWFQERLQFEKQRRTSQPDDQDGDSKPQAAASLKAPPSSGTNVPRSSTRNPEMDVVETVPASELKSPLAPQVAEVLSMGTTLPASSSATCSISSLSAVIEVPSTEADVVADATHRLTNAPVVDRIQVLRDRRDRKRMKDLAYSRDRRQREKDEIEGLQEQVKQLSKTNDQLRSEEARLAIMLVNAQNEIAAKTGASFPMHLCLDGAPARVPPPLGVLPSSSHMIENHLFASRRPAQVAPTPVRDPLLVALEQAQLHQRRREEVAWPSSLELAALVRNEQLKQEQLARERNILLTRIGALSQPRDTVPSPLMLQTLLDQERQRNKALLEECALAEVAKRRGNAAAVDPTLVLSLLEDQLAQNQGRGTLPPPRSNAPTFHPDEADETSQLRLLRLLQSGNSSSTQVPPLSDQEALLLRLLANQR